MRNISSICVKKGDTIFAKVFMACLETFKKLEWDNIGIRKD